MKNCGKIQETFYNNPTTQILSSTLYNSSGDVPVLPLGELNLFISKEHAPTPQKCVRVSTLSCDAHEKPGRSPRTAAYLAHGCFCAR